MICPACAVSMDYRGDGRHVCPKCEGEVYVPTPNPAVVMFGGPQAYREAWFRSQQRYMKAMRDPHKADADFWKFGTATVTSTWPTPPPEPDPPPKSEPRHRGKQKRRPPRLAG